MLLFQAEQDYLNNRIPDSLSRLQWLGELLGGATIASINDAPRAATGSEAQRERARTLLRQMSLGLDYFGNYQNHVTLLSADYYGNLIDRLIKYGAAIERQYDTYTRTDTDAKTKLAALNAAQSSVRADADRLSAQLPEILEQQKVLESAIDALRDDMNVLWVQLQSAEASFKSAVASQGNGCSFGQIAAIGGAVATLVSTGGAAVAAIGPALAALHGPGAPGPNGAPITDDFAGFKYEIKTVVKAGSKVGDFAAAAAKVGQVLASENSNNVIPGLPSDSTKLLVQSKDIEDQLKPFLNLEEARAYRNLIRTYVSTAEAQNNKILEYNNKRAEYTRTSAQIILMRSSAAELQSKISTTAIGETPGAMTFMGTAYLQAKSAIVKVLYEIDRCQRFFTLASPRTFEIENVTIGGLSYVALQQASNYSQALSGFGMGPMDLSELRINLANYVSEQDMDRFVRGGDLLFALPVTAGELAPYSHVLAQRIAVTLKGLPSSTTYTVAIRHHGRSLMRDAKGEPQVFSHVPLTTIYKHSAQGGSTSGTLVGDSIASDKERFVGVSPYGPWSLRVSGLPSKQLEKVKSIEISFHARGRALGSAL